MLSGVFTIPLPATEQVLSTGAAHGLAAPASHGRNENGPAAQGKKVDGTRPFRIDFIGGPENRMAEAASRVIVPQAAPPAEAKPAMYNPLVFHGPAGCGKSHLARGIAAAWRRAGSDPRGVICIPAGEWSPRLLPLKRFAQAADSTAVGDGTHNEKEKHSGRTDERRQPLRLLVLEDLHTLRQTSGRMVHFRNAFDLLAARGVQMVFTTRMPPQQMSGWPADLQARLSGGLVVPIALPGEAARYAILLQLAQLYEIRLATEAAATLAEKLPLSVPELLAVLAKLCTAHGGRTTEIGLDAVHEYLASAEAARRVTIEQIARAVSRHYGLKLVEITSSSRRRHIVTARGMLMYLARQMTGASFASIGRFCGGRDHTTTLHNCRKIETLLDSDTEISRAIQEITEELRSSPIP